MFPCPHTIKAHCPSEPQTEPVRGCYLVTNGERVSQAQNPPAAARTPGPGHVSVHGRMAPDLPKNCDMSPANATKGTTQSDQNCRILLLLPSQDGRRSRHGNRPHTLSSLYYNSLGETPAQKWTDPKRRKSRPLSLMSVLTIFSHKKVDSLSKSDKTCKVWVTALGQLCTCNPPPCSGLQQMDV
ncbi:hypothetical protein WMY93_000162 [Mugilogobius chulae]|uniref:Uncharacterized protein n=1 Tax=Mugilogobius chulae TaxID=88201 RepID=A0AAW0QDK5_9GOBI